MAGLIALVVLWTTARHEASHALVAWSRGADIESIRLLPSVRPDVGFSFGYVEYTGTTHWSIDLAPFVVDVALIAVTVALAARLPRGRWRRPLVLALVVSPIADLAWGWARGLSGGESDVQDLVAVLPAPAVHGFFVLAIVSGVVAVRHLHEAPPAPPAGTPSTSSDVLAP